MPVTHFTLRDCVSFEHSFFNEQSAVRQIKNDRMLHLSVFRDGFIMDGSHATDINDLYM